MKRPTRRRRIHQKKQKRRTRRHSRRIQKGGSGAQSGPIKGPVVVFHLTNYSGLFCAFFFLCQCYLYAKENGYPFYVQNDNWQYTIDKGWHDYFTSLETFPGDSQINGEVKHYRHDDIHLNRPPEYKISQYIEVIKDIFKPNEEIQNYVDEYVKGINGPFTSLYIRRGDKVAPETKEMDFLSVEDILGKTDIQDDGKTLFVQTDDYSVVEEIRKLRPLSKVMTLTPEDARGADIKKTRNFTPEQRKAHTKELIAGSLIIAKGTPAWSDIRSNVGRFHKLLNWDGVKLYPNEAPVTKENEGVPSALCFRINGC